jgi:hypothetical protein
VGGRGFVVLANESRHFERRAKRAWKAFLIHDLQIIEGLFASNTGKYLAPTRLLKGGIISSLNQQIQKPKKIGVM